MRRLALGTRARAGARPGAVARRHAGTQVVVLEGDACGRGTELVAGLRLSG